MYGMYCILIILTTIGASYRCLTEILDHGLSFKEAGLFLIAFYCMTVLFIICNEAHYTSHKMGPEFRERLLAVNLGKYFCIKETYYTLSSNRMQKRHYQHIN